MLKTIERRNQILKMVEQNSNVMVLNLAAQLGVSTTTIRNDLNEMDQKGMVTRVRGGAVAREELTRTQHITFKNSAQIKSNRSLAATAAELIKDGESIIIGNGRITEETVTALRKRQRLSILTNDLNVAIRVANQGNAELFVAGGHLNREAACLLDRNEKGLFSQFNFDKVLLEANSFDLRAGLTSNNALEAQLHRQMCIAASQVIVVAHSQNIGKHGLHIITTYHAIHTLVTDRGISNQYATQLQNAGVRLRIVDTN